MTKEITKKDYEKLMEANERELWALTEQHYRLIDYVQERLWPRACMTMGADVQSQMADELAELDCEVEV